MKNFDNDQKQILGRLLKVVNIFTWNHWQTSSSNVKLPNLIMSLSLWSKSLKIGKHLIFMTLRKCTFLVRSTKLKRAHGPPLFFTFFKSNDPNTRKNTTLFNFQFVIKSFLGMFNVLNLDLSDLWLRDLGAYLNRQVEVRRLQVAQESR